MNNSKTIMVNLRKIPNLLLMMVLFAGLLLISQPTFAQQESQLTDSNNFNLVVSPWVTKGGIYSFLYNLQYALRDAVTWNPHVKNQLSMIMANNSLVVAKKKLSESQNNPLALKDFEKSLNRYQQEIKEISQRTEKFKKKAENNLEQIAKFLNLNKFTDELLLQQKVLTQLSNNAPAEQKSLIENVKEDSLNNFAQVLTKIDEPAKIGNRLAWAISIQTDQQISSKVKNLEILQSLQKKLPAIAQEAIQKTQEKTLIEINEEAQNLKTLTETGQFKSIIEKSKIDNNLPSQIINKLEQIEAVLKNENSTKLENNKENLNIKAIFPTIKGKNLKPVKNIPKVYKPIKKSQTISSPKKQETIKGDVPANQPSASQPIEPLINNVTSPSLGSKAEPPSTETLQKSETTLPPKPETPKNEVIKSYGGGGGFAPARPVYDSKSEIEKDKTQSLGETSQESPASEAEINSSWQSKSNESDKATISESQNSSPQETNTESSQPAVSEAKPAVDTPKSESTPASDGQSDTPTKTASSD